MIVVVLALKHSQKVRMESHREATDNKKKKDPIVLSMKVAVMVLLVLVASTNKALLSVIFCQLNNWTSRPHFALVHCHHSYKSSTKSDIDNQFEMQKTFLICAVLVMTAVMASQEVRKEDHREAKDNKEEEDPVELVVVLAVVLVVVLKSAAGFLPVLTPVARVELEPQSTRFASTRIRLAAMSPPRFQVVPSATHKSVCHSVRIFSPSTCLLSFGNFTNTICSELIKAYCRLDQCTMERCSDRNDLFRVIESVGIVGIGSIVRTTRRPTAHSSQKSFREQHRDKGHSATSVVANWFPKTRAIYVFFPISALAVTPGETKSQHK
ncbi:hypothetical protein GEV33_011164 [Tenebrio molitor]|uniref:Uncharacterized protein n=1 Tax=Tenebrio molitor TaxID=7067 RepID=A0A8J6L8D6_TENMO|nr:hypothetical protein GEV33_011164 [Tenebrio molitor]